MMQNVRPAQCKHKKHMGSPYAHTFHLRQMSDHFFFRHLRHAFEFQQAGLRLLG